jgi:hypothetical protein
MIYLLDVSLSATDESDARSFMAAVRAELDEITLVSSIATDNTVLAASFGPADAVIFINPPREDVKDDVEDMLRRAADAGSVVLPVAMGEAERRPPDAVGDRQSFDVVDQCRRRGLRADQRGTVARAFAREALSKVQPTYVRHRLRVFLCHRRADGEGLVARVGAELDVRHAGFIFRDLVELEAGERAQEHIDEELARADVLVFFDTPEAGDSWWIAKELAGALGRNIPIVWVRLGGEDGRASLPVQPGASEPHLRLADLDVSNKQVRDLADEILERAFALSSAHVRASNVAVRRLQRWARENDGRFETLDARLMVYELTRPAASRPYPTRPAVDVVQFFARHPTPEDLQALDAYLTSQDMGPHTRGCRSFDAAILLDPTATGFRSEGEWSVVEHPDRFLASLPLAPAVAEGTPPPRLLLLGAFPQGDLAAAEVDTAVQVVATTWLGLGGSIVFGGHPTFTPLIVEAARLVVGETARDLVTVYQSEWFAAPAALQELAAQVTVVPTTRAADRAGSLTAMRTAMIRPASADAVLAIGGRTHEGGKHTPGIDEEIRLARAAQLPVHLLGATGGRAAELAAAAANDDPPFASLGNTLGRAANEEFMSTDDYAEVARTIWAAVAKEG